MAKIRKTHPDPVHKPMPSKTIPGQSLQPADVLKRHLAGTLPDIGKTPQYTHDSDGKQISEDLSSLELHELHDLSQLITREYRERAKQVKEETEEANRKTLIAEYLKTQTAVKEEAPAKAAAPAKGDGAAGLT